MTKEKVSDALLREFLLGTTDEEERQRIEGLFLTDSDLRDRVLAIEQDLIEDYLENTLATADREKFLKLFAQTPEQQRQLRITKSIKDWAVAEAVKTESLSSSPLISRDVRKRRWTRPSFTVPMAVALAIAIVLAIVWVNRRNEQERHFALEQELQRLNSPESLREVPQLSLELKPVTIRSVEPAPQLNRPTEDRVLELRLPWIQKERYSTYQARLRSLGDGRLFTIPNVQASSDGLIRLRLSSKILTPGNYHIELSGIAADGSTGLTEEYSFVMGR
jgi:hypothetical protein